MDYNTSISSCLTQRCGEEKNWDQIGAELHHYSWFPFFVIIQFPLPWLHLILKTMKRFLWCVLRIVRCRALQKTLRYPSLRDIDLLICFWISTFLHSQRIIVECKSKYYQIWITIFQMDIKCKLSGLLDWIQYTYMFEI